MTDNKVGAGGRTRTGTALSSLGIFLPATAFAALALHVCAFGLGLGSGLYLHHCARSRALGAARLVSTPSQQHDRPMRLARDCLLPVSPSLSSSASRVSLGALKDLSPLRLPIPPRPRTPIYTLAAHHAPTSRTALLLKRSAAGRFKLLNSSPFSPCRCGPRPRPRSCRSDR
jgi:hypothetical protein